MLLLRWTRLFKTAEPEVVLIAKTETACHYHREDGLEEEVKHKLVEAIQRDTRIEQDEDKPIEVIQHNAERKLNVDAAELIPEVHNVTVVNVLSATVPEFVPRNTVTETAKVPVTRKRKKPLREEWFVRKYELNEL